MLSPLIRARPTLNGGRARSSRDLSITVLSDALSQTGRAALLRLPRGSRKSHGLGSRPFCDGTGSSKCRRQIARSWNSLGAGSCRLKYGTSVPMLAHCQPILTRDRASTVQLRFWLQSRRPQHRDIHLHHARGSLTPKAYHTRGWMLVIGIQRFYEEIALRRHIPRNGESLRSDGHAGDCCLSRGK